MSQCVAVYVSKTTTQIPSDDEKRSSLNVLLTSVATVDWASSPTTAKVQVQRTYDVGLVGKKRYASSSLNLGCSTVDSFLTVRSYQLEWVLSMQFIDMSQIESIFSFKTVYIFFPSRFVLRWQDAFLKRRPDRKVCAKSIHITYPKYFSNGKWSLVFSYGHVTIL